MNPIQAQTGLLDAAPFLERLFDAVPSMAMLLNRERQIVLANRRLVEFVGAETGEELHGLRLGEMLECIHALDSCGGCGTTPHCAVCGALRATLNAQIGYGQSQICRMVRRTGGGPGPFEFEVWAAPLEIAGQRLTLICLSDATDRVQHERLEHAILPQAMALAAETEALSHAAADAAATPEARERTLRVLETRSNRLGRLIHAQDELEAAETGRLAISRSAISARELLAQAAADSSARDASPIRLDTRSEDAAILTDPVWARRALGEILLNAIEAAPLGGVSTGFVAAEGHVEFWVHNPGEIDGLVQLQLFTRGFSTKAPGRGYGAYFAKLITERYLGGSLTFRSSAGEGTTFVLRLPRAQASEGGSHD